jgi:hypothetical protein
VPTQDVGLAVLCFFDFEFVEELTLPCGGDFFKVLF